MNNYLPLKLQTLFSNSLQEGSLKKDNMYQEIIPSNIAKDRIESFWIFKENKTKIDFNVMPDGCIDLIFDFNKNEGFISGQMTQYQNRSLSENSDMIGIRIRIESFAPISNKPLSEFKNKIVDFSSLNVNPYATATQRLSTKSLSDKLAFLENLVLENHNQYLKDDLILNVVNDIRALKGNVKVITLAKSNFISIRQLERRFKHFLGITVKEFINIIRFQSTAEAIKKCKQSSLLHIAYNAGYFDHAHMNNDFKRIAGTNPSSFR